MLIDTKRDKESGIILHSNYFENLNVLVDYIRNTHPITDKWSMASENTSPAFIKFQQTSSLDEALVLCFKGYHKEFFNESDEKKKIETLFPVLSQKRSIENSVYGFRPNMTKFLNGSSRSMYKLVRNEKKSIINLHFNLAVNSQSTNDMIKNRGILTIHLIKLLEQFGVRVNLDFFLLMNKNLEYILIKVNLKSPSELFDEAICTYPMSHPAFLRRVCFAVMERVDTNFPDLWYKYYGSPSCPSDCKSILNISDNDILIGGPKECGIKGDNIYYDAISFFQKIDFSKSLGNNVQLEFDSEMKKFILKR